jgi:hypothetical protein
VSDGRWEIYVQQKKDFERLGRDEPYIAVNSPNTGTARKDLLRKLAKSNILMERPPAQAGKEQHINGKTSCASWQRATY